MTVTGEDEEVEVASAEDGARDEAEVEIVGEDQAE